MTNIYEICGEQIPFQLTQIPKPPRVLYVRGILPKPSTKIICIIGSRKYSSYGEEVTKKLISGLKGYDICIVSGLAFGIDSIAHRTAIDARLTTIAFPGSGLNSDVIYPSQHMGLANDIVLSGGALISEFRPDQHAFRWTFPVRNRLMAGISEAVVVIEAGEKSGTLITSRLALDYNKNIGAVPGDIFSPLSMETNRLIRNGATPITCSEDILEILGLY